MAAINNDWLDALKEEFKKPYYKKLFETVNEEYRTRQIFPPADDIFNAFHLTPLHNVKAVILGQDPYHNVGQAHGLCFSVKKGVDVPPSLVNIYKELHDDLGCTIPNHGCLTKWAEQGVLMLNTVLTVRAHQANSHKDIGWEEFTDAAIMALNSQDRPIVFTHPGTAGVERNTDRTVGAVARCGSSGKCPDPQIERQRRPALQRLRNPLRKQAYP